MNLACLREPFGSIAEPRNHLGPKSHEHGEPSEENEGLRDRAKTGEWWFLASPLKNGGTPIGEEEGKRMLMGFINKIKLKGFNFQWWNNQNQHQI